MALAPFPDEDLETALRPDDGRSHPRLGPGVGGLEGPESPVPHLDLDRRPPRQPRHPLGRERGVLAP